MSKEIDLIKEIGLLQVQIENAIHNFSKEHEWAKKYSVKMKGISGETSHDTSHISIPIDFKIYF